MDRKQAEKIIGGALEIIRLTCEAYDPGFDICSIYVTPHSKAAYILEGDQDDGEYVLNYYKTEDDKDESMAG